MLFTILWVVAALAVIGLALYKYYDGNGDYWTKRGVDSLGKAELATFWDRITFKVGLVEYDKRCYKRFQGRKYAGMVQFREPVLYLMDLDLIKQICVKDFDHFTDRRIIELEKSDIMFSKMLTNRSGKEWKELRSVMSPTFTTGKIKRMFDAFNICGSKFANYLRETEKTDNQIDFQDAFGRYAVEVIASIVFGIETDVFTNKENSVFRNMSKRASTFTLLRGMKALLIFIFPKLARGLGLSLSDKESLDFFTKLIEANMKRRKESEGEKRHDFLQIMLEAQAGQTKVDEKELDTFEKDAILDNGPTIGKKELSVVLDDTTVMAQAFLFFFAGFDTIESLLIFTAYELALNPEVQEKLAAEIIPVMEESHGDLTYENIQKLEYLDMIISETLRMHPPAFATERKCTKDYRLPESDVIIPKGMQVMIPINGIHHDEKYYPDPNKFNPENFNAENKAKRHPYAYLPFGQGPRNCIAMRFALTEAKAAIAHLVYNFKIEPSEKTPIEVKLSNKSTIKKPEGGMWLRYHSRDASSY